MAKNNKDSDLYQNKAATQALISEINKVAVKGINDLSTQVADAVKQLKNVHGIENVGTINPRKYNAFFDNISTDLNSVSKRVTQNDEAIDDYSNEGVGTRLLSTGAMGFFKFGEGLLSVGEDLGDGAASLVGWLAPKNSGLEKACESFVSKNWSHDVFNFYYNSDFAKKSYMKENSKVANCFKIAGTCVGYLYAGGAAAGIARGAATGVTEAAAKGAAKNLSKLATKTSKIRGVASTTTKANTLTMGVGGVGHGTEEGILEGNSINKAFRTKGLKEGAIGAGLGFGGGKLGEVLSKRATIKAAQNELKTVENEIKTANKELESATKNFKDTQNVAKKMNDRVRSSKNTINKANEKLTAEQEAKNNLKNEMKTTGDDWIKAHQKANQKIADTQNRIKEESTKLSERNEDLAGARINREAAKTASSEAKASLAKAEKAEAIAKERLDAVKNAKASSFEGYTDRITKAGQKFGKNVKGTVKSGGESLSKTAKASKLVRKGDSRANEAVEEEATKSKEVFKQNTKELVKDNPITHSAKGAKAVAKGTVNKVKGTTSKLTATKSKFQKAMEQKRVTTKTSANTKTATSANNHTYKVSSKPKQILKINNVNKTVPKATNQTVATTVKKPGIIETASSGKVALKETLAEKGKVFKDNLSGLFSRGSKNSVADTVVEGMAVTPAAKGLSGLKFARGANKVDDFTKTIDDVGEAATKGSSKVKSSDDVIDKFTKEDDELFKKLEEAKPPKEKPVEGKTNDQNPYKMKPEEKVKYDKLEAENLEHQKDIDAVKNDIKVAKEGLEKSKLHGNEDAEIAKDELEHMENYIKNKEKELEELEARFKGQTPDGLPNKEVPLPGAVAATINATHNTKTDPIPSYLNDEGTGADTGAETVDDSSTDETQIDESQTDTTETNTGSDSGYSSDSYSDGGGDYSSSYDDSSTSPEDTTTETPTEDTTEQPQETETEETQTDQTQTDETQNTEQQTEETQTEETQTEETQPTDQTETNPEDTYTETTQTDTKDGTVTTTTPTKSADYDDSYYDDSSYNDSNDNMEEFVDSEKADEGQLIDDTNPEEEMEEEQIYDEPVEETETDENTEVLDDLPLPTSTKKKGNIAIPLIAGIATAGAAGTGAKIYLDRKKNKDNLDDEYEYEEDEDYDYDEDSIDDVYQEEQESTDIATEAIDEGERYTSKPNSEFEDFI